MAKSTGVIGTIQMWSGSSGNIPTGWLPCDGSSVLKADYPELAAVMGEVNISFPLPDLMTRLPVQGSPGEKLEDELKYSKVIDISASGETVDSDNSYVVNVTSSSEGSHNHSQTVQRSVFLDNPTSGSNGFSHHPGGGVSHNANNNTPSSRLMNNSDFNHTHYARTITAGQDSHTHSVTLSGSADHSHTASFTSEVTDVSAGGGAVTMPPRQYVIYIIRAQ